MINMLVFFILFSILAAVLLSLLSSHTRFMETDIRRIKGYYASEAANVAALDSLRRTGAAPANQALEWIFSKTASPTSLVSKPVTITTVAGACPGGTRCVNATMNYATNW